MSPQMPAGARRLARGIDGTPARAAFVIMIALLAGCSSSATPVESYVDAIGPRGCQYAGRAPYLHLPALRLHRGAARGLVLRHPGHTAMGRARRPRRRGQRR